MPFSWKIDSRQQLMEIRAEGPVVLADCAELLQIIAGAQCPGYRKLLDIRLALAELSPEELTQVVALVRDHHAGYAIGALAIVTAPDRATRHPAILGALAAADRPIQIFATERRARKWLASLTS